MSPRGLHQIALGAAISYDVAAWRFLYRNHENFHEDLCNVASQSESMTYFKAPFSIRSLQC